MKSFSEAFLTAFVDLDCILQGDTLYIADKIKQKASKQQLHTGALYIRQLVATTLGARPRQSPCLRAASCTRLMATSNVPIPENCVQKVKFGSLRALCFEVSRPTALTITSMMRSGYLNSSCLEILIRINTEVYIQTIDCSHELQIRHETKLARFNLLKSGCNHI